MLLVKTIRTYRMLRRYRSRRESWNEALAIEALRAACTP